MGNGQLVRYDRHELEKIESAYTPEQLMAIAGAIARAPGGKAPAIEELQLLAYVQRATNLDWFRGELGMASFKEGTPLQPYISYKGMWTLASRAVQIVGEETLWRGREKDDEWVEFWLDNDWGPPAVAKVTLWLKDVSRPVIGIATWDVWAKGQLVDEQIPDPSGATEERMVEVWKDDPSGATWTEREVKARGWASSKIGRRKQVKMQEGRRMPALIYTGRKILQPLPGSTWATIGSHMLAKQAIKLASEKALRITGRDALAVDIDQEAADQLRRRAFGLLKELGREKDDAYRHELSGGRSWSELELEDWLEVIAKLTYATVEKDFIELLEQDGGEDPFDAFDAPGRVVEVQAVPVEPEPPEPPAPTEPEKELCRAWGNEGELCTYEPDHDGPHSFQRAELEQLAGELGLPSEAFDGIDTWSQQRVENMLDLWRRRLGALSGPPKASSEAKPGSDDQPTQEALS